MATVTKKTSAKSKRKVLKTTEAHLPVDKHGFSKKEAIKLGFKLAKKNIIFFIGLFVIVVIVSSISSGIQIGVALEKQPVLYLFLNVLTFVVNAVISIGLIKISLEFIDGKKPKFSDLFYVKPLVNFILASLIRGVITFIGFILFIIPGIILAIYWCLATWIFLDQGTRGWAALKQSQAMVSGYWWAIFLRFAVPMIIFMVIISLPTAFMEEKSQAANIYSFIVQIISMVLTPFFTAYVFNIYKNLKEIKA